MAATPRTTQARPSQAVEASVSPRKSDADRDADRHPQIGLRGGADRAQGVEQPEIDGEGERRGEHRQREQRQHRVHGWRQLPRPIDDEAGRNEDRGSAQHGAGRRHDRIEPLEAPPEDRRAGIADGGGDDRELRDQGVAEAAERFQPNDQADARHARHHAEQLAGRHRLVPHQQDGEQEGEDRRGRIEDGGKAGIDNLLAPRDQREGDHAVEAGLDQEAQPQPRSFGSAMPRRRITSSRIDPAIKVRAAIKVTGGIVSTPTLMKL